MRRCARPRAQCSLTAGRAHGLLTAAAPLDCCLGLHWERWTSSGLKVCVRFEILGCRARVNGSGCTGQTGTVNNAWKISTQGVTFPG
jgi:hypothetical protein